jgi:hypothetical protein
VTTADGFGVWHTLGTGGTFLDVLSPVTLEPGEQLQFEEVWPQADNGGAAVEPGTYLVHGVFFPSTEGGTDRVELETEATELVISP